MGTQLKLFTMVGIAMLPLGAFADDNDHWYATANLGLGSLSNESLTYNDGFGTTAGDASFGASFTGGGTLGYRFRNGFSLEGEITYRRNDLDPIDVPGLGSFTEGDFASLGLGLNALYRFNFGDSGKWSAYVGPGIVYLQEIDIDFEVGGEETSFETSDTAFQVKFGGRYDFSERWFAEAGATYLAASGVRMELPEDSSRTIETDYDHWAVSIGVGLRF